MKFRIAAIFPALLCSSAFAEEGELPEVVVEAWRGSVLSADFAGSATVIDADVIAGSGSRSLADLLVARGGLRISSTSGNLAGGQIQMRGFGENSSSRVLILIDGRPANRPDMAGISLLELPLSRIERVEILRGSQTARFGDNAVGGVINLVTKKAGSEASGFTEIAGGDDGYFLARTGYSGHGISFDAERNFSEGWRENAMSEMETMALRWSTQPFRGATLDAGISWADELTGFPGPLGKEEYEDDPRQSIYAPYADQYFSKQTSWRADAVLASVKGSVLGFEIPVSFSERDQEWNFGPGSHTNNLLQTFSLTPTVKYQGTGWNVEAGLNGRHDELSIDQYAEIQRLHRIGEASLSRDVVGMFSSADWEFARGWHLEGSARIERSQIEARAASNLSPNDPGLNFSRDGNEWNQAFQLGVRWEGRHGISSWFRYDRLYRLPSTDEIASYQGYPLTVPFNDQLKAEKGHNFELGAEYSRDAWRLRINGFAQWLEGEIAYDYLRNLNVNFADTRRFGVEVESGYQSKYWNLDLRASWLKAQFDDGEYAGNDIYLVPRKEFGAVLAIRPFAGLTLQGEYQFVGDSYEGNDFENTQDKLPSYGIANVLLRYEFKPGMSVYFRVNNVADERYATVKYSGVWYPAAGRQMMVGMRCEF